MRMRFAPLLLLMLSAGACDQAARPDASMVQAAAAPVTPAPAPFTATTTTTTTADAELAVAVARDDAARAAREQTLRVQRQLREQQREQQQQARDAASHGNERCMAGQRMRRVANGWVDAGAC
jgi:hypothetical protein